MHEETKHYISPSIDQEDDLEAIHQFLNQATNPVPCQVDLGIVADNFEHNLVEGPSESDWDTTLATSVIKFFGGMEDHGAHRRDFRGDEDEEQRQEIPEQDQTEVAFGFPIFDVTRDIPMKNIPPLSLPHFHSMTYEDLDSILLKFDIMPQL